MCSAAGNTGIRVAAPDGLGTVSGGEPIGDGWMYQLLALFAPSTTLTFFWNGSTTDSITFDWQDAY